MNTEGVTEEKTEGKPLQFDAHEFDGLREALEQEAEGMLGRLDQYIRENPWVAIGAAAAAGFLLAYALRGSGAPTGGQNEKNTEEPAGH